MQEFRVNDDQTEDHEEFLEEDGDDDAFVEEDTDQDLELESITSLFPSKTRRGAKTHAHVEEELRAALADADPAGARAYAMERSFAQRDLIRHEEFGLGIVAEVLTPRKIRVLFQEGSRILVMNYFPQSLPKLGRPTTQALSG